MPTAAYARSRDPTNERAGRARPEGDRRGVEPEGERKMRRHRGIFFLLRIFIAKSAANFEGSAGRCNFRNRRWSWADAQTKVAGVCSAP